MPHPSHTCINVAERDDTPSGGKAWNKPHYVHFFRVEIDRPPSYCAKQIRALQKKFPAPRYAVDVTYWECLGHAADPKEWAEPIGEEK